MNKTSTSKKPCVCGRRSYRASDDIRWCPDCAPNKSLSVYRDEESRRANPELPLAPAASARPAPDPAPETPEQLRARARQIRSDAQFAEGKTYYRERAQADELDRRAAELEAREVAA